MAKMVRCVGCRKRVTESASWTISPPETGDESSTQVGPGDFCSWACVDAVCAPEAR